MPADAAEFTVAPPRVTEVKGEPGGVGDVEIGDELYDVSQLPDVDETQVRFLLRSLGGAVGAVAGDPDVPKHWRFTEDELDDIAPPLTRIVNRRPRLKAAVIRGDEAAVALALAGYIGSNIEKGIEARAEREREAEGAPTLAGVGIAGPGGPAGTGRPADAGHGRANGGVVG